MTQNANEATKLRSLLRKSSFVSPSVYTLCTLQCYLLITEPHLPPRVSRDIHAAQEDPLLVTVVEDGGTGVLGLKAPHQLGLD